jgi:hypothetical protein
MLRTGVTGSSGDTPIPQTWIRITLLINTIFGSGEILSLPVFFLTF